jgi:hypothetical protein
MIMVTQFPFIVLIVKNKLGSILKQDWEDGMDYRLIVTVISVVKK